MADTYFAANDPAAVKLWSRILYKQAITRTVVWKLANIASSVTSPDNIVQILDDTQAQRAGATITYDLVSKLTKPGVLGDNEIAGEEEALTLYTNTLTINQLRHAVKIKGAVSQQRIPHNLRDLAKAQLGMWWAERDNVGSINQATGNTNQTDVRFTWLVAPVAPDAAHMVIANVGGVPSGGHAATEAALALGDTFDISLLLDVGLIAETNLYPIRPFTLKGMEIRGVFIGHPLQIRSMKKAAPPNQWSDIQLAAMTGGQITRNPIFTGAVGMYNGIIIHSDAQIPYGNGTEAASRNALGTANVARGVFMGAQALTMAMGRAQDNPNRVKWFEEILDAGNVLRVTAGKMYGGQKNRFANQDFATVTVSSYEVQ